MKFIMFLTLLVLIPLVSSQEDVTSFTFKQGEDVNFSFVCLTPTNDYCSTTTQLLMTLEKSSQSGGNLILLSNHSLTGNPTFFNTTLPTLETGKYSAIIISPGSNFNESQFTYLVNDTGRNENVFPIQFSILGLGLLLIIVGKFREDLSMLQHIGSMMVMVMGVSTLYPGYSGLDGSNIQGLALGSSSVAIGFWFLIERSFSRKKQDENFTQDAVEDDGRFEFEEGE